MFYNMFVVSKKLLNISSTTTKSIEDSEVLFGQATKLKQQLKKNLPSFVEGVAHRTSESLATSCTRDHYHAT